MKLIIALLLPILPSVLLAGPLEDNLLKTVQNGNAKETAVLLDRGADPDAPHDYGRKTALAEAAYAGHGDIVKLLLKRGAQVNSTNKDLPSPLIRALLGLSDRLYAKENKKAWKHGKDHAVIAKMLLEKGADIHAKFSCYQPGDRHPSETISTLGLAARDGHIDLVRPMVKSADPDSLDWSLALNEALLYAAREGRGQVAALLLDKGANPNAAMMGQMYTYPPIEAPALFWAAKSGSVDAVKALLRKGAEIKAVNGYTAVAVAAAHDRAAVIPLLVRAGISPATGACTNWTKTPLECAARKGAVQAVKALVKSGADPNEVSEGKPTFFSAENAETLKTFLDLGADAGAKDNFWQGTMLHSYGVSSETAKVLLARGLDINQQDKYGSTPLIHAAKSRKDEKGAALIKFLLARGAKTDAKNKRGETALMVAMAEKNTKALEILKRVGSSASKADLGKLLLDQACDYAPKPKADEISQLLEQQADPNIGDDYRTPLTCLVAKGKDALPLLQLLIDKGADVNRPTKNGETPLSKAVESENLAVIEFLLKAGAKPNRRDKDGKTVLYGFMSHWNYSPSSIKSGTQTVRALLAGGADPTLERKPGLRPADSDFGDSALAQAARGGRGAIIKLMLEKFGADNPAGRKALAEAAYKDDLELIKFLVSKGANPNSEVSGYTPLYSAAGRGNLAMVKLLVSLGADVNKRNGYSSTPLMSATEHPEVFSWLLSQGADAAAKNADGATALEMAALMTEKSKQVLSLLVAKGLDVNTRSDWTTSDGTLNFTRSSGWTPLHKAARNGRTWSIPILLEAGADMKAVNSRGKTPLAEAEELGHKSVVDLLRRVETQGLQAVRPALAASAGMRKEEFREIVSQAVQSASAKSPQLDEAKLKSLVQEAVKEGRPQPVKSKQIVSDVDAPKFRLEEKPYDFAVVVGIEKYSDLPEAQFAERDAEAVKKHLVSLGWPVRNIIHLAGSKAVRSALEKYLEEWLPRNVRPSSRVLFYFSGHGAPDTQAGRAYLVPWDGDPAFLARTAYPISRLYEKLAALKAAEVIVAMDACFSGAGGRSVLPKGARPLVLKTDKSVIPQKLTVLAAASDEQITSALESQGHGTFTYFLLKGLGGEAKDSAGRITARGLHRYLTPKVQDEARRQNRDQTPTLHTASDFVLR
ncbi:MAG: ankyrin repeat domain-containing protein [Elusimicrobiota bacterium]